MRQLLWLGVLFLSASWLFFIPQFTEPDIDIGIFLLILGIICIIGGLHGLLPKPLGFRFTVLIIPVIAALFFVRFPSNMGLVVLAIGLLISVLSHKWRILQTISLGISLSGLILLIQAMVFPCYVSFVSHGHRVDILASVISPLANLLGLRTSTNNNLLYVQGIQQIYPVTITWEKLGADLLLNMIIGALVLFVLFYESRTIVRNTMIVVTSIVVYVILRFLGILAMFVSSTDLKVFWDPMLLTLSFLPFAFLLMKLLPMQDMAESPYHIRPFSLRKRQYGTLVILFVLLCTMLGGLLYQDPGSLKQGRILIDEYHSDWEDTIRPMDTDWYGQLSTYNYFAWAQWLRYYYTVSINVEAVLTPGLLERYDILILKCPTVSYTTKEILAVKDFVNQGGGLYLIGDHTNVFGMNTFLNQISEEFGIRFNTDATYELGTGDLSVYIPDHFSSHAVMRHVDHFDFMTSCTLEPTSLAASLQIEPVIIGNRIISEPGTYATENFFRESVSSPDSKYGYLLQAAAMKHGAGRVVAFTDSTVFSSFCMFTDGYPPFTLGVLQYLNRTNVTPSVTMILFALSALLLVIVCVLLRNERKIAILWMILVAGLLAYSVVAPLCSSLVDGSYPLPPAQHDYTQVCFEQQHSSMNISVKPTASLGLNDNNYGTFFVWTERLGCVPSIESSLIDAITKGDIIVIINPTQPFTENDVQYLIGFWRRGGRLLVMDSIRNTGSTANELLGSFGIWITTSTRDQQLFKNDTTNQSQGSIGNITTPYFTVTGGTKLLTNDNNEICAALTDFENTTTGQTGRLIVVVDSSSFSDTVMGGLFTEPTESQRHIYDTEFFLLNKLLTP